MRPRRLALQEIQLRLAEIPAWRYESEGLHRELAFANFSEAFGFMARAALEAERIDHHPEWTNVYSKVAIRLTTHDAGGVTDLDFALAMALDRIAGSVS